MQETAKSAHVWAMLNMRCTLSYRTEKVEKVPEAKPTGKSEAKGKPWCLSDLPQGCHLIHWHVTDTDSCLAVSLAKYGEREGKALISLLSVSTRKI